MQPFNSIAIVTYKDYPDLYEDDVLFKNELVKLGYKCEAVCWDSDIDWKRFDHIIIRSPWDYCHRVPEFMAWLDILEASGKAVWNPVSLMRWNIDKMYLHDLQKKGIPIIPTIWIEPGDNLPQLNSILAATKWKEAILKPSISNSAFLTMRVNAASASEHQATLGRILSSGKAMLQPFIPEIQDPGEYSFLFFGGEYQYTVLKTPRAGDFRVQHYYESVTAKVTPPAELIAQAQKVMDVLHSPTLYARVDMVNINGQLHLMELELIEPTLYMEYAEGSAARLADIFSQMKSIVHSSALAGG